MTSHGHIFSSNEIELANGRPFNPAHPNHHMVDAETIAHSLSNQCRFGGHCSSFYSIAEHSVLVASKLRRLGAPLSLQHAGLFHDAAEALNGVGDVQRPAKGLLDHAYRERERKLDQTVWRSVAWPDKAREPLWQTAQLHDDLLKRVDVWAVLFEASILMGSEGQGWEQTVDDAYEAAVAIPDHDDDRIECWSPATARRIYLDLHRRLVHETYGWAVAA